jgi:hypothetical protein
MRFRSTRLLLGGALLALLALGACGGGGGGSAVTATRTTDVPDTAQQSSGGFIAFLSDLIANHTDGTSEPLLVGDAKAPTDDTSEPAPLQ